MNQIRPDRCSWNDLFLDEAASQTLFSIGPSVRVMALAAYLHSLMTPMCNEKEYTRIIFHTLLVC